VVAEHDQSEKSIRQVALLSVMTFWTFLRDDSTSWKPKQKSVMVTVRSMVGFERAIH